MIHRISGNGYHVCAKFETRLEISADRSMSWMAACYVEEIRAIPLNVRYRNIVVNNLSASQE